MVDFYRAGYIYVRRPIFFLQGVLSKMGSHKAQIAVNTICVFIITFWLLLHVSQLTVVVQCS